MLGDEQYAETVGKRMTEFPIERRDLLQATGAGLLGTAGVGAAEATGMQETSDDDLVWEFTQPSSGVSSSPTIVDGTVYVGSSDNTLYAVDADSGSQEWVFETDGLVWSSPTVAGERVFVGSVDNSLYAVDADSGSQEWAFDTSGGVVSSPTVADNTVYVGANGTENNDYDDAALYAVDAATGEEEWAFTQPSNQVSSSPTVADGTVYVGSNDSNLYAVDAATGSQEWAFDTSGQVSSSPTVADGTVYVGSIDVLGTFVNALYAVDAATGSEEWTFTHPDGGVSSSPTVADGTVYVGSNDSNLYAVDAATGSQEWAFTQPSGLVYSSPTVTDGTIYVGSDGTFDSGYEDSALYAVDAATGTQEWAFTHPDGGVSSSPTVADGTVYVGSDDNTLYAVDAGVEGLSEGSRVLLQTLGHHDENIEQPPDPDPTGTVAGQVTDEAGDSLADTTVEFVPTGADTPEKTTTTNDSGAYEVKLPPDTTYEMTASKSGYVSETAEVTVEQNMTHTVDFELGSSMWTLTADESTGSVPAGETFSIYPVLTNTGTVTKNGSVQFIAASLGDHNADYYGDRFDVESHIDDGGDWLYEGWSWNEDTDSGPIAPDGFRSPAVTVTIADDVSPGEYTFALTGPSDAETTATIEVTSTSTGTVTGQVTDEAGDSLADATVEFVPTGADTPEQTTTTNDSGNYEVELPADTTYDVTASKSGYVSETAEVTVEQNTTQTVDFTLLGTGTVTGQVTDEAGDSLANVTIECVPVGTDTAEKTVTTDDSGTYDAELPTDSYELTATREEYVSETAEVTVEQNTTQTVDFILSELNSLDQLVQTKLDRAETIDSWSLALAEYDDVEPLLGSIQTAVDNGTLDEAPAEEAVQRLLYGEAATTRSLQLVGPDSTPPVPDLDLTKETVRLLFDIGVSIALSYLALKKRLLQRLEIIDPGAIDNLDPQDVDKLLDIIEGINFTKTMQALANLMLPEETAQEAVAEFESIAEDIITDIDAGLLESGEEIKNAIEDAYEGTLEIFAAPLRIIFETGERPLSVTDRPGLNSHLDELHQAFTVEDIQSGLQGDREGAAQGLIEGKEDILTRAQNMNNWITGLDEVADKTTLLGNIPPILNWLAELGQGGQEQQVTPNVAVSAVIAAVVTIEKVLQVIGFAIQGAGAVIGLYGLERMQSRHGITIDAVVEGDPNQFIPPFDTDQGTASVGSLDWQGGDGV